MREPCGGECIKKQRTICPKTSVRLIPWRARKSSGVLLRWNDGPSWIQIWCSSPQYSTQSAKRGSLTKDNL